MRAKVGTAFLERWILNSYIYKIYIVVVLCKSAIKSKHQNYTATTNKLFVHKLAAAN